MPGPEEHDEDAAAEIRRLRQTIRNIVWGIVVAAIVAFLIYGFVDAQNSADRNADKMVECLRAGRSDC